MAKPQLYELPISPSCQRVFSTFAAKGVDYDRVDIDISKRERPEDFNKISPFGKVPVLVHDGDVILESLNIMQYIDEVWPDPPLMPSDPKQRAYARQWIQYTDRELMDRDVGFVHGERELDRKQKLCADLFDVLAMLDKELEGNNGLFLGPDLSLVDCMIAPTINNIPIWANLTNNTKWAGYKNVQAYADRLRANPILAENVFSVPDEVYEGFFKACLVDGMTFPA